MYLWKHDIAWARERAKQIHNYMKSAKDAVCATEQDKSIQPMPLRSTVQLLLLPKAT